MTIKLSETLLSVFETDVIEPAEDPAGFDLDEEETAAYQTLAAAIDWDRGCLDTSAWTSADCEVVWGLLVDLANSYDDALEHNEPPDLDRRFAARARNGLSTLSIKLSSLTQQNPRASMYDEAARFLAGLAPGDILDFGKAQFVVERTHGVTVTVTKARTSGKKLYTVTPTVLDDDKCIMGVIEINPGSGDRLDKPPVAERALQDVALLDALPEAQVRKPRASKGGTWRKQQIECDTRLGAVRVRAEVRGNWAVHKWLREGSRSYAVTLLPEGLYVRKFTTRQGQVVPRDEAKSRVDELLASHPELEYADSSMMRAAKDAIRRALWGNE